MRILLRIFDCDLQQRFFLGPTSLVRSSGVESRGWRKSYRVLAERVGTITDELRSLKNHTNLLYWSKSLSIGDMISRTPNFGWLSIYLSRDFSLFVILLNICRWSYLTSFWLPQYTMLMTRTGYHSCYGVLLVKVEYYSSMCVLWGFQDSAPPPPQTALSHAKSNATPASLSSRVWKLAQDIVQYQSHLLQGPDRVSEPSAKLIVCEGQLGPLIGLEI